MHTNRRELSKRFKLIITGAIILSLVIVGNYSFLRSQSKVAAPLNQEANSASELAPSEPAANQPIESYEGVVTIVADRFSVKVPNGWTASISRSSSFTAIIFSKLDELDLLVYRPDVAPTINEGGAPVWNGLTEHFFILLPVASQRFNPSAHLEIFSTAFTFDDGHIGTKYDVVKHAAEAKKWGGLQRDTEWQGRTYIYEIEDQRIEAHLALYPSSKVDISFYENVVRTVRFVE